MKNKTFSLNRWLNRLQRWFQRAMSARNHGDISLTSYMPFLDLIKRMCHRTSDQSLQVRSWFIAIGQELYSYIYLCGSLKIYTLKDGNFLDFFWGNWCFWNIIWKNFATVYEILNSLVHLWIAFSPIAILHHWQIKNCTSINVWSVIWLWVQTDIIVFTLIGIWCLPDSFWKIWFIHSFKNC